MRQLQIYLTSVLLSFFVFAVDLKQVLGQENLTNWLEKAQSFKGGSADSILKMTEKILHAPNASPELLAECYYLNAIGFDKKGNYSLADRSISQSAIQFKAINDSKGWYKAKIFSAWISFNKGEVLVALDTVEYYLANLESQVSDGEMDEDWLKILGNGYSDLGLYYSFFKDKVRALESYNQSESYRKKLGDQNELAELWNNIGLMLLELQSYKEAEAQFKRSLAIVQSLGNKSAEASCFHNLGKCFKEQGKLDSALVMYEQCLDIRTGLKEMKGISSVLRKMALTYKSKGDTAMAFSIASKANQISGAIGDKKGIIDAEFTLAELFYETGNVDSAFWFGQRAYFSSKDLGAILDIKRTASFMKNLYKSKGMLAEALIASEDMQLAEQKLNDDEVRRMFLKKQYDEKQEKANQIIVIISIISSLLIGLVFFVYRAYRIKRKSNELITLQKLELQEKNTRIIESITYSERLQRALLPSEENIQKIFGKARVTYLAKDIVAGDFYWVKQSGNWSYLAVGDCTGHGVPGALVSMIGMNALNQAISFERGGATAEILNFCRREVIRTFGEQGYQGIRDGMDIGILALNLSEGKATWSGANRPCWYWNGETWLLLDADRQSVSWSDSMRDFSELHIENIKCGDRFVLYTDGLTDQFGGEKGKKLGAKQVKSFFYSNQYVDVNQQHSDLEELWLKWKGAQEQTDDLCFISIEI